MAPRRRTRRPWYRTRAYRLTRTAVLAVALLVGGLQWAQDEQPGEATALAPPGGSGAVQGARVDARAATSDRPPAGTGLHGSRSEWDGTGARTGTGAARPTGTAARATKPTGTAAAATKPTASGAAGAKVRPDARTGAGKPAPAGTGAGRPRPGAASPGAVAGKPRTGTPAGARRHASPPGKHHPPGRRPLPRSRATRLLIPYLDVDAPVMNLRLDRSRKLTAPPNGDDNLVGWYADGPSPGQRGTAVAVGHLDTDTGPAVFAGLTELKPGRRIEVRRADGRTAVYTVDAIRKFEKDHFPNREVYGPRARPELRLITCGGNYNRRTGYSGNVVVFAHLALIRAPATH
ncbi:class F sortase [Streptomyces sp. NPDC005374]|uniref:class F sortase n=1 Tax=Streptomyces sp. NPDC005374 TaxID=3364713 RepID=UPI00369D3827